MRGKGAGLVHNMNGDIWMGEKVGGECILIYKSEEIEGGQLGSVGREI